MINAGNSIEDGSVIEADVCIVGGGPAAIVLALEIASTSSKVVMIPGGGWSETPENQSLHQGVVDPPGSHEPLEENRRRQFGGASAIWGGRCIPFDGIDFQKRDWVEASGWPFSYEELEPYYRRAADWCSIGNYQFNARQAFPRGPGEILEGFDHELFHSRCLERWSPPIEFAREYRRRMEENQNLEVFLDAHVLAFRMAGDSEKISHVEIASDGRRWTVKARRFVLAAGGIENPRLLLVSANDRFPTGLGNQNDQVGRCYMSHLFGTFAEIQFKPGAKVFPDFELDGDVYCRRRWWLTEEAQTRLKLRNLIFFLYRSEDREGHRDALFSAMFLAKALLGIVAKKKPARILERTKELAPAIKDHALNLVRNGPSELPAIISVIRKRMSKRRLPYILPSGKNPRWGLFFQAEHSPVPQSRVRLSSHRQDLFGTPLAEVSVAFDENDVESVIKAHNLFVERFRSLDVGTIRYNEKDLRSYLAGKLSHFNSCAHHLGTTRMAETARSGVVDPNSKVFGIENLFVAGASVFPTGGHANPTLTLLALTLRLGDHLRNREW